MNQAAEGLLRAITRETDARFWAETHYKPGRRLNPRDPEDAKMARVWLKIHREILGNVEAHINELRTTTPAARPAAPTPTTMPVPTNLIFDHEPGYGLAPMDPMDRPEPERPESDAPGAPASSRDPARDEPDPGRLTLGRGLVLLGGLTALGVVGWWVAYEKPRIDRQMDASLREKGLDPAMVRREMQRYKHKRA